MGSENIKLLKVLKVELHSEIRLTDDLLGMVTLDSTKHTNTKFLGFSVSCDYPFRLLLIDDDLGFQVELYIKFSPSGVSIPKEVFIYIPNANIGMDPSSRIIYNTITASDVVEAIEDYCTPTYYGTKLLESDRGFDDYVWRLNTDGSSLGHGLYTRKW